MRQKSMYWYILEATNMYRSPGALKYIGVSYPSMVCIGTYRYVLGTYFWSRFQMLKKKKNSELGSRATGMMIMMHRKSVEVIYKWVLLAPDACSPSRARRLQPLPGPQCMMMARQPGRASQFKSVSCNSRPPLESTGAVLQSD